MLVGFLFLHYCTEELGETPRGTKKSKLQACFLLNDYVNILSKALRFYHQSGPTCDALRAKDSVRANTQ